jgi:hypothetical protein
MAPMLTAHHYNAFLVIAACFVSAAAAGITWRLGRRPRSILGHLLAGAQTLLVAQVALGLLLLSQHRRAPQQLHYLYGTLALLATLAPWYYAPADPKRRLAWWAGATLVAGALAVRAYLTGTR